MPWFTVQDNDVAPVSHQARWFSPSINALAIAASGDTGVISGLTCTAVTSNMVVTIAAGVVLSDGIRYAVSGTTKTISDGDATDNRIDLIVVDTNGAVQVRAGSAATNPKEVTRTDGDVLLCQVYVPAGRNTAAGGLTTATHLTDRRTPVPAPRVIYASKYLAKQADTVAGHTTALTNAIAALLASTFTHELVIDYFGSLTINNELLLEDVSGTSAYINKTICGMGMFTTIITQTDSSKGVFIFRSNVSGNSYSFSSCQVRDLKIAYQTDATRQQTRAFGIGFENAQQTSNNTALFFNLDRLWITGAYVGIGIRCDATTWQPSMTVSANQIMAPSPTYQYDNGFTHRWKIHSVGGGTTGAATEPTWRQGRTTLNDAGGINSTDLTAIVTNSGVFVPATTPFNILIESEELTVTGIAGNTLTVTRGAAGTTAAAHADGVAVYAVTVDTGASTTRYYDEADIQYMTVWGMQIGSTLVRIHDWASQAIRWATGYGAGQPENRVGNLYCQNTRATQSVEPALELENVEIEFGSLGIEDTDDFLIRCNGNETFKCHLLHLERNEWTGANSFLKFKNNNVKIDTARAYNITGNSYAGTLFAFAYEGSTMADMGQWTMDNWTSASSVTIAKGTPREWQVSLYSQDAAAFTLSSETACLDGLVRYNGQWIGGTFRVTPTSSNALLSTLTGMPAGNPSAAPTEFRRTCVLATPGSSITDVSLYAGTLPEQPLVITNGHASNTITFHTTEATSLLEGSAGTLVIPAKATWSFRWQPVSGRWHHIV